jgi:hypothetical protein
LQPLLGSLGIGMVLCLPRWYQAGMFDVLLHIVTANAKLFSPQLLNRMLYIVRAFLFKGKDLKRMPK